MLQLSGLRKALKFVMFLLTCLSMTGCYTLETVSVNTILAERKILTVHADNTFWNIDSCSISDGFLTGHICTDETEITRENSANVWVAPVEAVIVEGTKLSVPTANIGLTDCYKIDGGKTAWIALGWAFFAVTIVVFFF